MSALATLAGLFPPNEDEKFIEHLNWQTIPVHTFPAANDYLLASQRKCDRFDLEMQQFISQSYYRQLFKTYKKLITYLREKSGLKMQTLMDLMLLYDTLNVEQFKELW